MSAMTVVKEAALRTESGTAQMDTFSNQSRFSGPPTTIARAPVN